MIKKDAGKENVCQTLESERAQVRRDYLVHWPDELSVAVLIDGEHNSPKLIGFIQSRAERLGALRLQYIYGNWNTLNGWESILVPHRLEPRHHRQVAVGKNATDIASRVRNAALYAEIQEILYRCQRL